MIEAQADFAGLLARLTRKAEAIAAWRKESAARLPVRAMERLGVDHPGIDTAKNSDDVLAMKLAGQFALENGDVARAANEFAKAAARSDDPALADEAVEVAIAAKDWELARSGIARWQQLRADDPALWQWRARLSLERVDGEAAQDTAAARRVETAGGR